MEVTNLMKNSVQTNCLNLIHIDLSFGTDMNFIIKESS